MPESLVLYRGSLNPVVAYKRWLLARRLTRLINDRLADIINTIELDMGTEDFTPIRASAIVTYMMRHSRYSRNAAPMVVEAMPGSDFGRRDSKFLTRLRLSLERLLDVDEAAHMQEYAAAGVNGVEVCAYFKNTTGSTVVDGTREPWGVPEV